MGTLRVRSLDNHTLTFGPDGWSLDVECEVDLGNVDVRVDTAKYIYIGRGICTRTGSDGWSHIVGDGEMLRVPVVETVKKK